MGSYDLRPQPFSSVPSVLRLCVLCVKSFSSSSSLRPLRLCVKLSSLTSFLFAPKYAKLIPVNTNHSIPKFPEAESNAPENLRANPSRISPRDPRRSPNSRHPHQTKIHHNHRRQPSRCHLRPRPATPRPPKSPISRNLPGKIRHHPR